MVGGRSREDWNWTVGNACGTGGRGRTVLAPPCPRELVAVNAMDRVPAVPVEAASLALSAEMGGGGRSRSAIIVLALMMAGSLRMGTMIWPDMKLSDSEARVEAMVRVKSHSGFHAPTHPSWRA